MRMFQTDSVRAQALSEVPLFCESIYYNMRSTFRCLQATNRGLSRSRTTSFIGLGRMGYQMAYNLFSKQYVKEKDSRFVVCDIVPDASRAFRAEFMKQYPNAQLSIVDTPEEWAHHPINRYGR